ncbi:sigma-70 family RNA polymerase sigma factor [Streptomyces sp. Ru87]|uniref:sigma-70 family RNA polymerase sigma factor n=1 Tax=Streptomyces sp. Ru87 TaxID=2044307 RepID=UPI00211D249B|nr:sigma-70 family RNA polymerase sigma factor [Streptomyces sp. Ru87]
MRPAPRRRTARATRRPDRTAGRLDRTPGSTDTAGTITGSTHSTNSNTGTTNSNTGTTSTDRTTDEDSPMTAVAVCAPTRTESGSAPGRRPGPDGCPPDEMFLRKLYEEHGGPLLRFAARLLNGDWHRAEDILQETAMRAWRHFGTPAPPADDLRPWLYTVVRNLVIDDYRARRSRPQEVGDEAMAGLHTGDEFDHALTAQLLAEAVDGLAAHQREVLLHLYYVGHSVAETSRVLGIPPGTVKSRSFYAIRRLRETLAARGAGGCG